MPDPSAHPAVLSYADLDTMRRQHPAWRLLAAEHAPLVASFLHRVFVVPNVRVLSQPLLVEALEDTLFDLRERLGEGAFPRPALHYLDDWAGPEKGWLRKFYPGGSDEASFDLLPSAEKAIAWLVSLGERSFVGTESRLLTLFDLLRQMNEGTTTDPAARIADLQRRRDDIDAEMARVLEGDLPLLDDTALKDRFQQFTGMARELLADFREIEQNFRGLDRRVRERISLWNGSKGALLQEIMGERDHIADSDQGRSFRAFWDFLMSQTRQEELTSLLDRVLQLPAVAETGPDLRLRRVHYDWLEAGDHAQRTVAQLSQQLRRFLDDKAWLENRRIMELLHGIEAKSLAVRRDPPRGDFFALDELAPDIDLPMDKPLFTPREKAVIDRVAVQAGDEALDVGALFSQVRVDKAVLSAHIRKALQTRPQVSLVELLASRPLEQGLGELVAYMQLAGEQGRSVMDDGVQEQVQWQGPDGRMRRATMPRLIFVRD